jgi:hypothetical protein
MNEKIGRYAFIIGFAISVIAGFVDIGTMGLAVLLILGIIVGLLNISSREVDRFLIGTIALMLVGTVGINLPAVGALVTGIISGFTSFVSGAALVVALKEVYSITRV